MSSLIIALDLGRNHITATLVRTGQLTHKKLSIERDIFYMRSFDNYTRNDPRLIISKVIESIDDLLRDFVEYYKEDDTIIGIVCSLSNSIDYQREINQIESSILNKYQRFFGLNLRLLLQSGLRNLVLRWKDKPYVKYYTPPTSPRATISYLTERTKTLTPSKLQTLFNTQPVSINNDNEEDNSKLLFKKLKDYCGLQENVNNQLASSDQTKTDSSQTSAITFEYPPKLASTIQQLSAIPISLYNKTECFAIGELNQNYDRILAITLGTHFDSTFLDQGEIIRIRDDVPNNGILSNCFCDEYSTADECFSTRGLINIYIQLVRRISIIFDGSSLVQQASNGDQDAIKTFQIFAYRLGQFLSPHIDRFHPDLLLIGGGLAQAWYLMETELKSTLKRFSQMNIYFDLSNEKSICFGAVQRQLSTLFEHKNQLIRQTDQYLLPVTKTNDTYDAYDSYPCHEIPIGYIGIGYKKLNEKLYRLIKETHVLLIDGFIGIDFDEFANELNKFYFQQIQNSRSQPLMFYNTQIFLQIPRNQNGEYHVQSLKDLIDFKKLNYLKNNLLYPCVIMGPGASFLNETSPLIYLDLPKNELRYRIAAQKNSYENQLTSLLNEINNFHSHDYPIFNQHKQELVSRIDFFIDSQRPHCPTWLDGNTFRQALAYLSNQSIRLQPSFNSDNGIILSDIDQHLAEFSSDILYNSQINHILGNDLHSRLFNEFHQFPIQFRLLNLTDKEDFQQTYNGINEQKAYYRIKSKQQIKENSFIHFQHVSNFNKLNIEKSLKYIRSYMHEFFFPFDGTIDIHNETDLILEITTEIEISKKIQFGFDKPRRLLGIHGTKHHSCQPKSIRTKQKHYKEQHLPTPDFYIYDVHRLIIKANQSHDIIRYTKNRFHLCLLVEGDAIEIEYHSFDNFQQKQIRQYNYLETFLIPGSIEKYSLRPILRNHNQFEYFLLLIVFLKWDL